MLSELYIRNYLFVSERRLSFKAGMTVISGETGAGKSILVGSIALIFGDRTAELEPFNPEEPIYLEATFDELPAELREHLHNQGYSDTEELVLAREYTKAGKSIYFLNGRKVAQSLLKELKGYLVDFHHQRDQQKLLNPEYQLEVLDNYAGLDNERDEYSELYRKLKRDLGLLTEMKKREERDKQLRELYQYQFEELDKAQLKAGEDKLLQDEFELLTHSLEITQQAASAASELNFSDASIYDQLRSILARLSNYAYLDPRLKQACEALGEAQLSIQEASNLLEETSTGLNQDPDRLDKIQHRLDLINGLLYKHKVRSIDELLKLFEERQAQLNGMDDNSKQIIELENSLESEYQILLKKAETLSQKRNLAAEKLAFEVVEQTRKLSIPKAEIKIRIDKKATDELSIQKGLAVLDTTGKDEAQVLFSANPGASLKALAAVASGGELSRVLLAVKSVLSERLSPRLMILDEIDAGIGGKTAEQVAGFICSLSARHQVLCISHLAQIAVFADQHLAIEKQSQAGKTVVVINELMNEQRLSEIARMLSGSITELSLLHAKELIEHRRGNE